MRRLQYQHILSPVQGQQNKGRNLVKITIYF